MKYKNWILTIFLFVAGFLMVFFGVLRGEHQTVLEKAIKICLECIGIG